MGRKSSIDKLPSEVRARVQKHLRENRLTLVELIADLQKEFPDLCAAGVLPSVSAVQRYSQGVREIVANEREMAAAAEALVGELGEDFDAKSGALLAQAVTTLANKRAFQAIEATSNGTVMDISDVLDLARAAKVAQEARSLNLKERRSVADEARRKLLEQQEVKLQEMRGSDGMSEQMEARIRRILLGKE
ncbi:phage protein Gp27 family protein [Rhodoferax sp. BLA1]|uniref:phage protein Gp27 family protein n=1 Tax=Rhodoferax sp. BLA1 TaxID=2576062 RepID=UPI0015D2F288|nr:phage protein Gp27 family protein [Rhodoferax sp. BLA1]